jgi:hypothetical protein
MYRLQTGDVAEKRTSGQTAKHNHRVVFSEDFGRELIAGFVKNR